MKVRAEDRDRFFQRDWTEVVLHLPNHAFTAVRLSESFWRDCSELRSAAVGRWLREAGLAPWPHRQPPALGLSPLQGNHFELTAASR